MSKQNVTARQNRTTLFARVFALALLASTFAILPAVAHAGINSNFTVDGKSRTCNGLTGGNQCVVFNPFGTEYFEVVSGSNLALLDWTGINLYGTFPATFNFVGGYVDRLGGGSVDYVTSGTATIIPTPEPSALFLPGAGLSGLLALARRRFNLNSIA